MAGVFTSQSRPILTFTVVTTLPSHWMARIHNRMPAILQDDQLGAWLNPPTETSALTEILKPCPEARLEFYPFAAKLVNSDTRECADRIDADVQPLLKAESSADTAPDLFQD